MLFVIQVNEIGKQDPLLLPTIVEYPCNLYKAMLSFLEHWTGVPEHLLAWAEFCSKFEQSWYQCRSLMHEKIIVAGLEVIVSAVEAPDDRESEIDGESGRFEEAHVGDKTFTLTMCHRM